MPVTFSGSKKGSSERTYSTLMDWTRKLMQASFVVVVLLYAYLLYGLFFGSIGQWATVTNEADRVRIIQNIDMAIKYLNIALGVLLLSVCIAYFDEEVIGYVLVAASVALYYGLPLLFEFVFSGQLADWTKTRNNGAIAIFNQFKILALMLAVVGGILAIRDLILRVADGSSRKREEFSAMQYGGKVEEEKEPAGAILGAFAKCWQLPFCRPAIRKNCPIFLAKTKCWKERVGCMCEERVIRHSMDEIISKEAISFDAPQEPVEENFIKMDGDLNANTTPETPEVSAIEKTQPVTVRMPSKAVNPRHVKIPHNPNLSNALKAERCRNCTIYNEHQRKKYQMLAPILVLGVPGLVILKIGDVSGLLNRALNDIDSIMSKVSLGPSHGATSNVVSSTFGGSGITQYLVIGCLVIIVSTMALRFLEFLVFKVKI
ncbi:MAG: hypothetical protein ABJA67_18440 [Chthonomonadales bacterium]